MPIRKLSRRPKRKPKFHYTGRIPRKPISLRSAKEVNWRPPGLLHDHQVGWITRFLLDQLDHDRFGNC